MSTASLFKEPESRLHVPRDYQTEILAGVKKGTAEGFRKQLVLAATGTGKSCCGSWIVGDVLAENKRSLILVDQGDLAFQWAEKLKQCTGHDADIEKAELHASRSAFVVIATVQSLVNRLDKWPANHFDLVIADEADKSLADTWMKCLSHFDAHARICGFTATPWRSDARDLGEYYDNIASRFPLNTAIKKGALSKLCIQMVPLKIETNGLGRGGKDYTLEDCDHAITPYLGSVIDAMQKYGPERKTLVFVPLIRTSEKFVQMCQERGLRAEHIDGESDDRDAIRDRFENGTTDILVNSMLLTRGVDIPCISRIVPLRMTKSVSLYHQIVGRGTRLFPGKENLMVFDFLYQAEDMLICRPANLLAKNQEEADEMTAIFEKSAGGEEQDLLAVDADATHAREEALAKKLQALANRKARFISAEQFAVEHHQLEIAEFEPTMKWESDRLSPKQSEWIEKAGVDPESVKNKGQASKILDCYFKELNTQPASPGQKYHLRNANWVSTDGMRTWRTATRGDAREFFAAQNSKPTKTTKPEAPVKQVIPGLRPPPPLYSGWE